jgi:CDP-diacylglycerol--glycerol-3-phosphate 3-phosphatidyltransferase
VGSLVLDTQARVVPVWIEGAHAALPKGAHFIRRHPVEIRFGTPLHFTPGLERASVVASIEQQVRTLATLNVSTHRRKGKTFMATKRYSGIYAIKPWWQGRLASLEDILVRHNVHPDVITSTGVVCAALLGLTLLASGQWPLLALAVPFLAVGRLAANALDGLVARRTGKARPAGEMFNECCDRVSDVLIFGALAFTHSVIVPLAWGVLVLALLSSFVGITARAAGGKRQFGGFLAKADRMIYLAVFSPIVIWQGPLAWNWLLLAFLPALLLTFVQRYRWATLDLKQEEEKRKSNELVFVD